MRKRLETGSVSFDVKNMGLNGFNFIYTLIADAANTAPNGVDLNKVTLKAVLHQAGGVHTIIPTIPLSFLLLDHALIFGSKETPTMNENGLYSGKVYISETASIPGRNSGVIKVRFANGIVLKGADKIEITVNHISPYDANCDAGSYCEFEPNEVVTNQDVIPYIHHRLIPTGQSVFDEEFGDNVRTQSFVCIDAISQKSSPLVNSNFESDRLKYDNRPVAQLFADRNEMNSALGDKSVFVLANAGSSGEFDDVRVRLDLESANVVNGQCAIVTRSFDTDIEIMEIGKRRMVKHATRARQKFSV